MQQHIGEFPFHKILKLPIQIQYKVAQIIKTNALQAEAEPGFIVWGSEPM